MTPLAPHLSAWLRQRLPIERGASSHTCDTYAYAFQLLLSFASERLKTPPSELCIEHFDAQMVLDFLLHIQKARGNGATTRNARLAAIKSFMHYLEHRVPSALDQLRRVLAIPAQRTDTMLVRHLGSEETRAILDGPDPTKRLGLRDRAMLYLGFTAGLRVSELVGLRCDQIIFRDRYLDLRVCGKGRRERSLTLWKQVADAIRAWLAVRGDASAPELFVNARGEAMTRAGFEYVLRKHVAVAAAKCPSLTSRRVSPHILRHTCAMNTLQATGDIRKVALWLGHASQKTTEVYLAADPTEKLDAMAAISPPPLRRGRFRPPDRLLASLREQGGVMRSPTSTSSRARS